jgi:hypothetical protein
MPCIAVVNITTVEGELYEKLYLSCICAVFPYKTSTLWFSLCTPFYVVHAIIIRDV